MTPGPVLPKTIYEFAYATGARVVEPKRHQRHALNLQYFGGPDTATVMDMAHKSSGKYNVYAWSKVRGDYS